MEVEEGIIEVHLAVDTKTSKILSMEVTKEDIPDGRMLKPLVEQASSRTHVVETIADGAYDSKANFNFFASESIKPVIRVRKSSAHKSSGSYARKLAVVEQQAFNPKS